MTQDGIVVSHLMLELSDCLEERLTLDIADCTAHLDDCDCGILRCEIPVESALYLIGDMRDNLYCSSAVVTTKFFL